MFWKKNKSHQNNLFVSIGGGINQIPLIDEAKKLGFQTIGVDRNICAAGMHKCDIRIQESIENYLEIHNKLEELLFDGEIKGVLTRSFGPAIKTASFLSEKLNIPLLPFNRVDDLINKERMKKAFKSNDINSPDFMIYSNSNLHNKKIKFSYPFVIKPIIGHAKNKVELIRNSKDFDNYLSNSVSKNDNYLIEKYILGEEVIVIGIVQKGKFYLVEMTDKIKSKPPYFVDILHSCPSKYIHLWNRIQEIGQKITNSFEIHTSPMLMELIISDNEDIYVIETAPEFGGEFLSDILVPERTGYNIIRESIKAVSNRNFNPPPGFRKSGKAVVVKYITGTNGILLSFNPVKSREPGVLFSRIFKDIGSITSNPATNHDRIGVVVAKGNSVEEALKRAENSIESLNIRIEEKVADKKIKKKLKSN
jgi:biotin carboxylase